MEISKRSDRNFKYGRLATIIKDIERDFVSRKPPSLKLAREKMAVFETRSIAAARKKLFERGFEYDFTNGLHLIKTGDPYPLPPTDPEVVVYKIVGGWYQIHEVPPGVKIRLLQEQQSLRTASYPTGKNIYVQGKT